MKPCELVLCLVNSTAINRYVIMRIEVDLRHINYGLDRIKGYGKKRRSCFTIEDIVSFFESLNNTELNGEIEGDWEYYVVDKIFFDNKKKHRMVFCIDKRNPQLGGIITMYQLKRSDR